MREIKEDDLIKITETIDTLNNIIKKIIEENRTEKNKKKVSKISDKEIKKTFFKLVKDVLLKTTEMEGKITYDVYQIGFKKIPYSTIFDLYDINTNESIGEYIRDKHILRLY